MNFSFKSILTLFAFLFFASSCDLCKNTDCSVNGNCSEGECICNTGYYGDACEDGYIDALLNKGSWLVNLYDGNTDGDFIDSYYSNVQSESSNALGFFIPGLFQIDEHSVSINGVVGNNWLVTIPETTDVEDRITISGSGKIWQTPSGFLLELDLDVNEDASFRTYGVRMYPSN